MVYLIAGIFVVFCTVVIFFAIRVYKENRKMAAEQKDQFKDDADLPLKP